VICGSYSAKSRDSNLGTHIIGPPGRLNGMGRSTALPAVRAAVMRGTGRRLSSHVRPAPARQRPAKNSGKVFALWQRTGYPCGCCEDYTAYSPADFSDKLAKTGG
jgi:hypothetical protein